MEGDPAQIQQLVMNLVINAWEAMGGQTGAIALTTRPEQLDQGTIDTLLGGQSIHAGLHVGLQVSDNGCGMTPEVLKQIFDPFFTTKFTGRGLGLAAVIGTLRSHQGGLRVRSTPDRGTSFKLYLPAMAEVLETEPA
jgi:signal transduction histidine kinase